MRETSDCLLCSYLCVKKPIKNTTSETYCVRHCCQDTPKRAVMRHKTKNSSSTICRKRVQLLSGFVPARFVLNSVGLRPLYRRLKFTADLRQSPPYFSDVPFLGSTSGVIKDLLYLI